ncbi:hypothetical protein [Streptomyces sp. H27-D2]|uniref:hypothetical protein n=1 Tax=Streptomyces sp. H27-D2 TaxID=3046304 RepID=UPI002DBCA16E|nr:hypothetical protein [Streptomyces sp. H27-D2]MEC4017582.1 hypothetical protein [Streptomyces sp. H27-D2]
MSGRKSTFWERRRESAHERGLWELREALCSRINELEVLVRSNSLPGQLSPEMQPLAEQALKELQEAEGNLHHTDHPRRLPGAHLAVSQTHFDVAHALMLRFRPSTEVQALTPGLAAFVREHLPASDQRRVQVEEIALSVRAGNPLDDVQREMLVDAVTVARQGLLRENLRVRSFTYVVFGMSIVLTFVAVLVAVLGSLWPTIVPLCFRPNGIGAVCATASDMSERSKAPLADADAVFAMVASGWDYPVVEFVGLVAAAIAAAASLRRIRGTSSPYNVPVALALLKLPTGALTAVLGLLLMRGEFVPGLSALDSSAQIIAWAVLFGYAQQLFTRFVDTQAQTVLNSVGSPNGAPGKPGRIPQAPAT